MSYIPEHIPKPVPAEFSSFVPLSDTDIQKLIISRPTKHCDLDPIPTWLLKQCSGTLLPIIKSTINASLLSGLYPDNLKEAILKPLLKKLGLDPACFKNLRPISNLAFISKFIEGAVCNQYNTHILSNDIAEIYQSAYKASHCVETAIVCVHNDIVRAIDNKQAVLLVLLDPSATFDTVDHCKLLEVLKNVVGISGTALAWFASYLKDRTQKSVSTMNIHPRQNSSVVYHKGQYWAQFFLQRIYSHSVKFWGNWGWSFIVMLMPHNCIFLFTLMIILVCLTWKDIWP